MVGVPWANGGTGERMVARECDDVWGLKRRSVPGVEEIPDGLDQRSARPALVAAGVTLIAAVALTILTTTIAFEVLGSATAYISGEGHWSRSRVLAEMFLNRYGQSGDPDDLASARRALSVPLGDRMARRALDSDPPDLARARVGFLAGRNAEDDLDRIIWMYRHVSWAPYFSEALDAWAAGDRKLDVMIDVADRMERHWRDPEAGPIDAGLQTELDQIAIDLARDERAFGSLLTEGSEWFRRVLLLGYIVFFLLVAAFTATVYVISLRRIRSTESLYRAAFVQSVMGMAKLLPDGRIVAINKPLAKLLRLPSSAAIGRPFERFLGGADGTAGSAGQRLEWSVSMEPVERQIVRADGSRVWCRISVSPVTDDDGGNNPRRVFVMVEDVTESRRLSESLAYQASHDSLTGLINRREIERRLKGLLSAPDADQRRHTLCYVDLDQFKLINDTSSHSAGDQLLMLVASTLPEHLRPGDWIGRLGGDEFAVLFRDTPADRGRAMAQSLNRALSETSLLWEGRHFNLTSSMGLVEINSDTPSVSWLLRAADTACYLAKEGGRNRVHMYVESDTEVARRQDEMSWVGHTRAAIAEGRLRLFAQKIVALQGHPEDSLQYEILVRLEDADGQLWQPGSFLGAVERFGLAQEVDVRVVELTLNTLSASPQHVARLNLCHINVSGQSVASAAFRSRIIGLLDRCSIPANKLCFELTETSSIGVGGEARAFIDAMRSRGCRVALDDFGSGLSSFAYLKTLPVDILKIDGMFVRDVETNPLDMAVVNAVTAVGRALGKVTVAEWVESEATLQCLREAGVDRAQGFVLHRPCPLEELVAD